MTVPSMQLKWTRTKWDAAREFYWYAQNNYQKQACPYLNLRETPWDFSDPFALWIIALTQEANGQWEWKGEQLIVNFLNDPKDNDEAAYLRAEQDKLVRM